MGLVIVLKETGLAWDCAPGAAYLLLQVGSGESMNFIPEIEDAFVHRDSNTRLKFARDAHGVVTDLILLRNGEHRAARISSAVSAGDVQTVTLGTQTYRHLTSASSQVAQEPDC